MEDKNVNELKNEIEKVDIGTRSIRTDMEDIRSKISDRAIEQERNLEQMEADDMDRMLDRMEIDDPDIMETSDPDETESNSSFNYELLSECVEDRHNEKNEIYDKFQEIRENIPEDHPTKNETVSLQLNRELLAHDYDTVKDLQRIFSDLLPDNSDEDSLVGEVNEVQPKIVELREKALHLEHAWERYVSSTTDSNDPVSEEKAPVSEEKAPSNLDDFADTSCEPADYMGGDD